MRVYSSSSTNLAVLLMLAATVSSSSLETRAFPNAPNGYSPQAGDCPPDRPSVRDASTLSRNETSWLEQRRKNTFGPMRDLLGRLNIAGLDIASYITSHAQNITALPNIAIAVSGGGYRATLNGGGIIQAFDSRENNSTAAGHLGGLLQSSTYLSGLSGGGWLVGSIYVNNFTTISGLQNNDNSSSVWELGNSIFQGPAMGGIQTFSTAQYFENINNEVGKKSDAGFETSITDYWGRALSYQLVNASDGGPSYTWSSIQLQDSFANADAPMPILVSDGRAPGETLIPSNTTVYEFNPFELGSWDPTTYGFVPLEFLGSNFTGGTLPNSEKCVRGFDNAGFVMGTSSSLFNSFLISVNSTSLPPLAKTFINGILRKFNESNNDIADYTPNPFYGYHNSTSLNAQSERLSLVDGGEDLQNIPFHPLIQPHRAVDVIFAVDSSADTPTFWPNGASIIATYERAVNHSLGSIANGTSFPAVPDNNTFINLGLNNRPTFFGCNSSNTSTPTPLVVYLPNAPYVYQSNISTFTDTYNTTVRDAVLQNGYEVATMGNGTVDSTWPSCVGCAILSRSLERTKTKVPDVCVQCFQKFCWDGTINSTVPAPYEPPFKLAPVAGGGKKSGATRNGQNDPFSLVLAAVITVAVCGGI